MVVSLAGGLYTIGTGYLISKIGGTGAVLAILAPVVLTLLILILLDPRFGLFLYVQLSFIVGFTRFVQIDVPVGLLIDGLLALTLLSLFINGQRMHWRRLRSPAFILIALWFLYTIIELFNPEAPYQAAWFYQCAAILTALVYGGLHCTGSPHYPKRH